MRNWYPELLSAVSAQRDAAFGRTGIASRWFGWLAGKGSSDVSGGALRQTIADLNSRQQDMAFLSDVAQLFQACRTVEEICNVARDRLQGLSRQLSGALYLMSETKEYLENVMAFGAIEPSAAFFVPGDCWSLRCGRPHQLSRGHDAIAARTWTQARATGISACR
ncbi:MAG: hypothetical protein ACRED5_19595 [Propylenella sp.]